ncbi:MAG: PilZ domain-containing protein [Holophagaceae bacterium]|nr:PilZ domain-containing protein [Holophagaceae bacterium]
MAKVKNNKVEIQTIFKEACDRRESLIFVTPYLRFESNFVHLDGHEVHARVTLGRGDALSALSVVDLKLRFPYAYSFLEAPAKLLGPGLYEGIRTIRFALPAMLYEHDDRKSFRVDRGVGNIIATIGTPANQIIVASVVDISAHGAKLSIRDGVHNSDLKANDKISLSIPIPGIVTININAIIRYMENGEFGLEYTSRLPASTMDPLGSWIFIKQEEERGRIDFRRSQNEHWTDGEVDGTGRTKDQGGILAITSDDALEEALKKLLSEENKFYRAQPTAGSIKKLLEKRPHLVIFHIPDNNLEVRRLSKSLIGLIPMDIPTLLMGTGIDSEALSELGQEWKVASSIVYTKERGILIHRLVLGMIRKHFGHGESPMAPKDF